MAIITFLRGDKTALTKNFARYEFQCPCGCGQQSVDMELAEKLQLIRDKVDRPLKITSGYRCITHNAAVGGSQNSKHRYGGGLEDGKPQHQPGGTGHPCSGRWVRRHRYLLAQPWSLCPRRHPWHESDVALHHAGKVPQHDLQQVRASHHPSGTPTARLSRCSSGSSSSRLTACLERRRKTPCSGRRRRMA